VLFADLVGFTSLVEHRDAEEVRELLSRYFETAKRLISLYGGTVEKFIGDAVMAVWGTPVAQEDDAERAVRAALDLVAGVHELGQEVGAGELLVRAGVLTGEAAVTLGAEGQGMVAGDLVNTASRIQAAAEPGTVLVGEGTRRASEAAVAYEEAGLHELKGKAEAVPLFRALRVTASRGGALKAAGLEPPFVGRERELRLVKELFHASADESKLHLVSVVGIAGIGKSRLAWEFEKYLDGVAVQVRWHRGRCLAYGDGVAYWALAEMVRSRAGIIEGEEPTTAQVKLKDAVALQVSDPEERDWIEPRLAHLLGLEQRETSEREDLFAAWRLFFECMAERQPTVLVFEDMQWADASLLEFVDYLLEWSRDHAIFVLTLARPELAERHPDFGKARRNAGTVSLDPLSAPAMEALLDGFAPGLPAELHGRILARAEGVPLYAVETVRMLLDRGLLARQGEVYVPAREIGALDVPETLHALIAARLDGLAQEERQLIQDASVLGKTFTKTALADLSGIPAPELEPLLAALVRKEVLSVQADLRSPERGQYGFLQDLLMRVAYETLSRRERKARHLAAADSLERSWGPAEHEVAEIVAAHFLAAYEAAPEAEDAPEIKTKACEQLTRAGERAASLAANEEAEGYFEEAAALADDHVTEAGLRERAGRMAWLSGRNEAARAQFERALELYEEQGATHPAARVSARLGEVEWRAGQLEQALVRMEQALALLAVEQPDEDLATLAAQLGRLNIFKGNLEVAAERIETALEIAESLGLPEVLAQALTSKGFIMANNGRLEEAFALQQGGLALALKYELGDPAARAYNNLADLLDRRDRCGEAIVTLRDGLALVRRHGGRFWERFLLGELSWALTNTGAWDEALECLRDVPEAQLPEANPSFPLALTELLLARGETVEAKHVLSFFARWQTSSDLQERTAYEAALLPLLRSEGKNAEALALAEQVLTVTEVLGVDCAQVKVAYVQALEATITLGELQRADQFLEQIEALPPGRLPPFLRAQAARFRGRLATRRGEHDLVEPAFKAAANDFREFGLTFWLAVTQLEHSEWLQEQHIPDDAEPLRAEAYRTFERLDAAPWLDRAAYTTRPRRAAEAILKPA
jgi:class 3 adenylate cyclase/tetratricopeptide (TPR) repeat protein